MPKYSFFSRNSKEVIKSINSTSLENAILFFAKIKALSVDKFLKLYEVVKR